jgi:hypothetical protein
MTGVGVADTPVLCFGGSDFLLIGPLPPQAAKSSKQMQLRRMKLLRILCL